MCFLKEIPGLYQLPTEASVVKAAAGWAHCASVNGNASCSFLIQWLCEDDAV